MNEKLLNVFQINCGHHLQYGHDAKVKEMVNNGFPE